LLNKEQLALFRLGVELFYIFSFFKIHFVDPLNILNNSLDKLCNVSITKGNFPYSFLNKNDLNYIGPKPNEIYEQQE